MTTTRTIAPEATEPLTVSDAKLHARIDHAAEDSWIEALIVAARALCESAMRGTVKDSQIVLTLPAFPTGDDQAVRLPLAPVRSVDLVKYRDTAGQLQTLSASAYQADVASGPPYILPAPLQPWPQTQAGAIDAVQVTYTAGFADAASVPETLRHWMLLHVAHYYRAREAFSAVNMAPLPGLDALLDEHRSWAPST